MLTLGRQKVDLVALVVVAGLAVGAAVVAILVPALLPWSFVAVAGGAVLLYWAARWQVIVWAWIWVLSFGLLDWPSLKLVIPGFFNMTPPRWIFLATVLVFSLHLILRSKPLRFDQPVLWAMLALTVFCTISAAQAGWLQHADPRVRGAPYFRLLGPLLFPFILFLLVYNATDDAKQIRWSLICLSIYAWYALYIGYLQYASIMGAGWARGLIWPAYINSPDFGHHFDRARGAFPACNAQANLLLLTFFGNMFLARIIRGPYRLALIVQAILIVPAIFFTGLRSAYLAFILCGIVWCVWGCKGRMGLTKLAAGALVLVVGVGMFWGNLTQTRRERGGIAQAGPIRARAILTARTWKMVQMHPLTGVGWGHYMEADRAMPREPGTLPGSPQATTNATPCNLFLVMAGEAGVVGLGLLVAVFALIYRLSLRLYRRLPPAANGLLSRRFVALFWVALTIYLTDAMFVDPLWDVPSNGLFWGFAGLLAGSGRLLEAASPDLSAGSSAPGG